MGDLSRVKICCYAVLFMMLFMGCSNSDGEEDTVPEVEEYTDPVPEPEPELIASFDDVVIEDGFTFDMQRAVKIDISFSQMQDFTVISVYSATDPDTNTPVNLLEKAEIHKAMKYTSLLPVTSYTESMVVVIDGDSYAELELPIDKTNHIHYLVE
ncbi:hypothetical protein Sps_02720 [Shewanella psychrophila]|uniref:Lipoprotein n=1 Tax=Shewanella psychrophila TaxID=225848 RepID=A0A1S6HQU2_9GAMM|nr:hypothetical protein [Shewanella psychrophila]AQS37872.1 hypothetical protein Sps_02720 [Shewanella psychrophila]